VARYRLAAPAELDLAEIWAFIAIHSVESAERMRRKFEADFALLSKNPQIGRQRNDLQSGLRSLPEDEYLIFYRMEAASILIVRVLHGHRDIKELFQ